MVNEDFVELTFLPESPRRVPFMETQDKETQVLAGYLCNRFGKRFQESLDGHGIFLYN